MSFIGVGDLARSFVLSRQTSQTKAIVQRLSTELVTGLVSDVGQKLGGDLAPLAAIETATRQARSWGAAADEAGRGFEAVQTALSAIETGVVDLTGALLTAAGTTQPVQLSVVATQARMTFDATIGYLNAQYAGRSLFSGTATDGPAVAAPQLIIEALQGVVAGLDAPQVAFDAVRAWFSAPTGFTALGFAGADSTGGPVLIGADDQLVYDVAANDPALREALSSLSFAALLDSGLFASDPAARSSAARLASGALLENAPARAGLSGKVGLLQQRADAAVTRNSAALSALETARAAIIGADPYEAAIELEATQTQLETLYALTARVTRLSLVDFLR